MADLEQSKETVRAFYDLAFNQKKPEEAVAATSARGTRSTTRWAATALSRSSSS